MIRIVKQVRKLPGVLSDVTKGRALVACERRSPRSHAYTDVPTPSLPQLLPEKNLEEILK